MPNPDRGPGDRWQSDAYRYGARDSRFAYRWNPDRFEERVRERGDYERDYDRGWRPYDDYGRYDRGGDYSRGFNSDRDWGRDSYDRPRDYGRDYGRDYDRGFASGYDRDRGYDRGYDYPRRGNPYYDDYDRDRWGRR